MLFVAMAYPLLDDALGRGAADDDERLRTLGNFSSAGGAQAVRVSQRDRLRAWSSFAHARSMAVQAVYDVNKSQQRNRIAPPETATPTAVPGRKPKTLHSENPQTTPQARGRPECPFLFGCVFFAGMALRRILNNARSKVSSAPSRRLSASATFNLLGKGHQSDADDYHRDYADLKLNALGHIVHGLHGHDRGMGQSSTRPRRRFTLAIPGRLARRSAGKFPG